MSDKTMQKWEYLSQIMYANADQYKTELSESFGAVR